MNSTKDLVIPADDIWQLIPALKTDLSPEASLPQTVKDAIISLAGAYGQSVVSVAAVYLSLFVAGLRGKFRIGTRGGRPVGLGFNVMPILPDTSESARWLTTMAGSLKDTLDADDAALRKKGSMAEYVVASGQSRLHTSPIRNTIRPDLLASELSIWGYIQRYFLRFDVSLADELNALYPQQLQSALRMLHSSWSGEELQHGGVQHHFDITGCFPVRMSDGFRIYSQLTGLTVPAPIICLRSAVEPAAASFTLNGTEFIHATAESAVNYPDDIAIPSRDDAEVDDLRLSIGRTLDDLAQPELFRLFFWVPDLIRRVTLIFYFASGAQERSASSGPTYLQLAKAYVSHLVQEHVESLRSLAAAKPAETSAISETPAALFRAYQLLAKITIRQPVTVAKLRKLSSKNQRDELHSSLVWLFERKKVHMDERGMLTVT